MSSASLSMEEAIPAAFNAAPEDFKKEAIDALYMVALKNPFFTTDQVWEYGLEKPPEPRALGQVMRKGARWGWMKSTDAFVRSRMPEGHQRPLIIWQSTFYQNEDPANALAQFLRYYR